MLKERPHFSQRHYISNPALAYSHEKVVNMRPVFPQSSISAWPASYHFSRRLRHLPRRPPPVLLASWSHAQKLCFLGSTKLHLSKCAHTKKKKFILFLACDLRVNANTDAYSVQGFVSVQFRQSWKREERDKGPSGVLLTTMCAGEGDLASLSACLLWRPPGWTSSRGHFICRYWMAERKQNGKKETKHVNNAESKNQKD